MSHLRKAIPSTRYQVTIVNNQTDADATHIYFGAIEPEMTKMEYDSNPKAFAQGWRDGWKWASKQSNFSSDQPAENMEKKLYGDIDNDTGQTKAIAFFDAFSILRHRSESQEAVTNKPVVEGPASVLDKAGDKPYQWTLRYIEQAAGVG